MADKAFTWKDIGAKLGLAGDNVAIRRWQRKEKSDGGIVYAEKTTQEPPRFGTVIAVGPGALRVVPFPDGNLLHPMRVKVGDTVIMPHNVDSVEIIDGDKNSLVCICSEVHLTIYNEKAQ